MVDDTRELVDPAQVGTALAVLSVLGLVAAVALGARARGGRSAGLVKGAIVGGAVAALFPLWLVYNRIEDTFGLDSVLALVLNLALFLAVGGAAGLWLRSAWPRPDFHHRDTETQRLKG